MPDGSQPSIKDADHQPLGAREGRQPSGKPAEATVVSPPAASPAQDPAPSRLSRLLPWRRGRPEPGLGGVLAHETSSSLSPAERAMLERIVAFDTKRVDDVAIPRADIVGVDEGADLQGLLRTFSEAGHSRLPVYRGDLDDPVGMVHIKDVVGLLADPDKGEPVPAASGVKTQDEESDALLPSITRRVLYVPPSMPITDLLLRMQAQRVHMALVIDEFGGTDGLVTIEDLIEEIVGDIRDEHDEDAEPVLRKTQGGRLDADARLELDDLEERTGLALKLDDEEADTVGGLVVSLAGRVPVRGEVIRHPTGYEFEVADADPRRVARVYIRTKRRRRASEPGSTPEPGPPADEAPAGAAPLAST